MKHKIIFIIFILAQGCANTEQLRIYNPYPDKDIILERKNVSCNDSSEIKVWYILYGSFPLNTVNTKEIFPSPDYSYKVEQFATGGDKFLSLITGLFFSVSRKTLRVETCQVVKKDALPEKKGEPAIPNSPSQSDIKLGELEKEVAFLKGKISGIESTVAMVSSNPPIENRKPESSTEYTQSRVVANSNKPEEESKEQTQNFAFGKENTARNINQGGLLHSYFLFKTNSFSLNQSEKKKLEKLHSILDKPNSRLLIVGYADKTGKFQSNLSLSWQRALKVKRILIGLGIKESRIQLSAAGETGDSKKSKIAELSRRVDLYLLEENL